MIVIVAIMVFLFIGFVSHVVIQLTCNLVHWFWTAPTLKPCVACQLQK